MRKNITHQEYTFKTLEDMYKFVNADNVDDFLLDFNGMFKNAILIREQVINDLDNKSLLSMIENVNDILEIDKFTWIDDGMHSETTGSTTISFPEITED